MSELFTNDGQALTDTRTLSEILVVLTQLRGALPGGRWCWERHGEGYALYNGRSLSAHGLNMLWVSELEFDVYGEQLRLYTQYLLNDFGALASGVNKLQAEVSELREANSQLDEENRLLRALVARYLVKLGADNAKPDKDDLPV